MTPALQIAALFSGVAFTGAAAGVWFGSLPEVSRRLVPLSGAILIGLSIGWIFPELAGTFGWPPAATLIVLAVGSVAAFDRWVHPVCPTCSHTHDHSSCGTRLHGFASPLVIAAILHSLFDGWAFAAGMAEESGSALSLGVMVHKIPEGLAFGVILRAAMRLRWQALLWAAVAQAVTVAGTALEIYAAPRMGHLWISMLLALGAGLFLYLGFHAMHGAWKQRSAAAATAAVHHTHD